MTICFQTGRRWLCLLGVLIAMAAPAQAQAPSTLPPDLVERLELLDTLKARGLISETERAARRKTLLDSIAPATHGSTSVGTNNIEESKQIASHRFDGAWTGLGVYEVNDDGRCPNIDIALSIDGSRVTGMLNGNLIGYHAVDGTISEAGVVSARTKQGNYNIQLSGPLEDGDWSFTFCSGSFSLSRAGG